MLNSSCSIPIITAIFQLLALLLGNAWAQLGGYNNFRSGGVVPHRINYGGVPYQMMASQNMFYSGMGQRQPYIPMYNRYPLVPARPVFPPMRQQRFIASPRYRVHGFHNNRPLPRVVTRPKPPTNHRQIFKPAHKKIGPFPSQHNMMHNAQKLSKAKAVFRTVPKAKSFSGLLSKTSLSSQLGG